MKTGKLVMFLALLGVIVAFSGSLQAKEMVYEPFDYDIGGLNGQGGTSDFGFDGMWTANDIAKVVEDSLTFGTLPTTGGSIDTDQIPYNRFGGARMISAAALADTGLLDDGATLWFSLELGYGTVENGVNHSNAQLAFALANNSFSTGSYDYWIQDDGAQPGSGVGVILGRLNIDGSNGNGKTVATQFRNLALGDGKAGYVLGDFSGTTYGTGEHGLIIGKIVWGAGEDTIEIYQPDTSMNLGDPISTLTVDVDQSTFDTITFCKGDRVVFDEVRFGEYSWDVLGTGDPMKPSPGDGETIMAADPLTLSWTNIPNDSNSVYVDVWFGTDPNEANTTYDMTKIVIEAMDVASTTVDASLEGTYYWQVNSYLVGDPAIITYNNDDPNDPNMIEGRLWSFTASYDTAPTLEMITPDQMTWSGGPVPLIAAVTNLGPSATIIEWIVDADSADDVMLIDGDTETPTVTITKLPYSDAKTANAGFEAVILADEGWGDAPGWNSVGKTNSGSWNPPATAYATIPEGENIAWVGFNTDMDPNGVGGGLAQILTETLTADSAYELTVQVGKSPVAGYAWPGYKIQLLAGGTVIAEDNNTLNIVAGTFETSIVNYTYVPEDANKVGMPLEIRLLAKKVVAGSWNEMNFDAVQLTADPLFPVSTGVETVTVTVFVSDEANPTLVQASVDIDVYDDACAMARLAEGKDDLKDFDKDCDIDIDDLATVAVTWLNDKSIDAPAVSPDQEVLPLVINGGFQMYKPGTYNTVTAVFGPGDTHTGDIEGEVVVAGGNAICEDGTLTTTINCPGWIESVPGVGLWRQGVANSLDTGNTSLETFGAEWGGPSRVISAEPLGIINSSTVYKLSAQVKNSAAAGPLTLDLLADGEVVASSSDVTPTGDTSVFQEISKTYNPAELAGVIGKSITIEFGTADDNTSTRASWDNVALNIVSVDANDLPTVDVGENMITWLGEPVTLTGTVDGTETNWDMEDVAYNWTASPSDDPKFDVVVSNPGDLNTMVTVTKVPYFVPYLRNGSFEVVTVDGGQVVQSYRDYWGQYDRPAGATVSARQYVPNAAYHFPDGTTPEGDIICRASSATDESRPDGPAILLGDVAYDPTATYELSVAVGRPHEDNPPNPNNYTDANWRGYLVQLVVGGQVESIGSGPDNIYGGTVVAEDDNSITIEQRTWETSVVTLDPSPELADLAGQPIQIRLLALDDEDPAYADPTKVFFDDVKLLINGETGVFVTDPGMSSVKMTLTVEEESTGKVASGSTSIDVYDDACQASVASDPELDLDLGDLNADCITNLEDFADVASAWLVDYSSTEPADKIEE